MSVEKAKNENEVYCKSIAKSVSDIIRFSLDEEFRKSSFELFNVSSTNEIEKEINKRLLSLLQSKTTITQSGKKFSKKRRRNVLNVKENENQQQSKETLCKKDVSISSTSTDTDSLTSQNLFQRNWLQISSQQYRNEIKKRKLNYFSQPQLKQEYQRHFGFSNSKLQLSNSQPSFSDTTGCSTFNETISSAELSDDKLNYCQKMFNESFKDNVKKYFKKNLKSFKHISFQ